MKVLVIEDDKALAGFLEAHLPARSFVVDVADTGSTGIQYARTNEYDLIILDIHLPDMRGDEVIRNIQSESKTPPILMLTVVSDVGSRVHCLNVGADDYLVKPFVFDELVARMRALLRRAEHVTPEVFSIGNVVLDMGKQTVHCGTKKIYLTRKEFNLLAYLMRHQGEVVPKSSLIEHIWDSASNAFSGTIETHMANLRKKLKVDGFIETIHSRGYLIN